MLLSLFAAVALIVAGITFWLLPWGPWKKRLPDPPAQADVFPWTIEQLARTTVELQTTAGTITLEFRPDAAPNHVRNFVELAQSGFYDGTKFHRVIPRFMIQGGDPNTKSSDVTKWGLGGSGRTIAAERNPLAHVRGTLSMARALDPHSASSQFFICDNAAPVLNQQYTAFGKVRSGIDVVDRIARAPRDEYDRPRNPVTIVKAIVHLPED
jgi:cyclophilin family peptidyl-prolyl cis-trans isomerase